MVWIVAGVVLLWGGMWVVDWAIAMKWSDGVRLRGGSVVTLGASTGSFVLLGLAMRTLPVGTAYTVWTGIGAIGAFIVGIFYLGESATAIRVFAAILILTGIVLMKSTSAG